MDIKLNLDYIGYVEKPDNKEFKKIKERIKQRTEVLTLQELMSKIEFGIAFKLAEFSSDDEWKNQQIFAISIENNEKNIKKYGIVTIDEIIKRCYDLGIYPAFLYETYNSTDAIPKFEVIFMLKKRTEDIRIRNAIQLALIKIFPESDLAVKDFSKVFYGTNKKCRMVNSINNYIELYDLVQAMTVRLKQVNSNPANITKGIDNYCKATGINIINGFPYVKIIINDESGKNMTNSINNNIEYVIDFPKELLISFNISKEEAMLYTKEADNKRVKTVDILKDKIKYNNEIRDFKFQELTRNCRLWNEFILNKRKCSDSEIFGIATNLWRIRGGEKRFSEIINESDFYENKIRNVNIIKASRAYGYLPQACSDFCPYLFRCGKHIMLESLEIKRGQINQYASVPVCDIEYAEKYLRTSLVEAFNSNDNDIHIIIAPTGIGKTAALEQIRNFNRICISYPTHKLGCDIAERLNIDNVLHLKELVIKNEYVLKEYMRLVTIGAYKESNNYIKLYKESLNINVDKEEIASINEYFNNRSKLKETDRPILCTHSSLILNQSKNTDIYIIDEDILLTTLIPITTINEKNIYDMLMLAKKDDNNSVVRCLEMFYNAILLAKANLNEVQTITIDDINKNDLDRFINNNSDNIIVNLRDLLNIKKVIAINNQYKEIVITGITKRELPNKKCIILSATANPYIYRKLFQNRNIKVYDSGLVRTKGKLLLHYQGYSRKYLKDNKEAVINYIKEQANGINNVITYKMFRKELEDCGFNVIAHFGACSGIDRYKGQNLIVLGTPHFNVSTYKLIAALITNNININYEMEYTRLTRSGYEFSFFTFKDYGDYNIVNILREIQFYLIESELIQAVGRARILREDANVHLFSNCPIPGSIIYNK